MRSRLFILVVTSALIALLSEFYLGLITLTIFVLIWCFLFIPPQLDAGRFLKIAKNDAYDLMKSASPNNLRINIVIEKLSRYPKDKEAKELIQGLKLKLLENGAINTALKCREACQ